MYVINDIVVSKAEFFANLKHYCKETNYSYNKAINKLNSENKVFINKNCFKIRDI